MAMWAGDKEEINMEVKRKRLALKTLSRNPLAEKLRAKKEMVRPSAPLKRAYMRRPEETTNTANN